MLDILQNSCYNQKCKARFTFTGGHILDNKIKELRKQNKVTQDELALAVGVTRQTIISLENGRYNASLQLAYKIARYFKLGIGEVVIFDEE